MMNGNIAQFLQTLVAITLDDLATDKKCQSTSQTLVNCLNDIAHLDEKASRECLLCPIAGTKNSIATTCKAFEAEGFCDDCEVCKQIDCPTACWNEFDDWLECKLGEIGCPDICQDDLEGTMIA
mmetsp:Transcript_14693/g.26636  ORF Transcript_14693/g.26636 Transcript_14693/m.26636 type:complete len:124 (-) Transcript_14693:351-722(-)|eukprot:CAMPEP_0201872416 /NCGR_PEP_ID=MMETSP0902-20130614/5129_1 /ASSEMBLY_ACC=CAM_ASM_000551 /TAXON_ID=420261 /ORGANISM="Thalassiosira antarctica, Strain CCMP982" /LENGTH=123 /DNA_ID=CAMNT_0048398683 /DNA_START=217 /DNA_END=588 /DNA_ORIENTATION=+